MNRMEFVNDEFVEAEKMTWNQRFELLQSLAIEKGYEIVQSTTPAYQMYDAIKGNIKIHIASVAQKDSVLANTKEFKESLENPKSFEIIKPARFLEDGTDTWE